MKKKPILKTRKLKKNKKTNTRKLKKGGSIEIDPENSMLNINNNEYWDQFHTELDNTLSYLEDKDINTNSDQNNSYPIYITIFVMGITVIVGIFTNKYKKFI
tara:strand:+ start:226 stop:531 length:306 start_codon:yes stop_codon:yes gene_type:complete